MATLTSFVALRDDTAGYHCVEKNNDVPMGSE